MFIAITTWKWTVRLCTSNTAILQTHHHLIHRPHSPFCIHAVPQNYKPCHYGLERNLREDSFRQPRVASYEKSFAKYFVTVASRHYVE